MKYDIEKHDVEIILDALQFLHDHVVSCSQHELNYPYTSNEVALVYQSLNNSGEE